MDSFESLVARKWATYILHYLDLADRLANRADDKACAFTVALPAGHSRALGDALLEFGQTVLFFAGTTVEISPGSSEGFTQEEVLGILKRARLALWQHCRKLSEEAVQKKRRTVLDPEDSTFVESAVVLIGRLNRILGEALLLARLAGVEFDPNRPDQYPSPWTDADNMPPH
jgi:hypothetical protein